MVFKSGVSRQIHWWTQISMAYQKFPRIWIKVKQQEERGTFSHVVNIYTQPNSSHVKFNIPLSLSSGHTFLIFVFLLLLHSLQLINSLRPESRAKSGKALEQAEELSGGSHGEPPQMPLPGHQWWAAHRVETARENCTLEEKAHVAAKLKISMVDFRLSQVV